MGFIDFATAVFAGNLLTIWFGAGLWQIYKHDIKAPGWAFGALLIPLVFLATTLYLTEGPPPHLAAIAPQPASASSQ